MEYKDIKTADELESWYAEKEDILEGHVRCGKLWGEI